MPIANHSFLFSNMCKWDCFALSLYRVLNFIPALQCIHELTILVPLFQLSKLAQLFDKKQGEISETWTLCKRHACSYIVVVFGGLILSDHYWMALIFLRVALELLLELRCSASCSYHGHLFCKGGCVTLSQIFLKS